MPPELVLPKARDTSQADQAEDTGAQRKGGIRSHRVDQEKFYCTLSFFPRGPEVEGVVRWVKEYNSTLGMVLGLMSPSHAELAKLRELADTAGETRCHKLISGFEI